ncbi:MAG: NAD(P)-dependent oxidoreductase [Gammaproteobacteria bacterium]|jgi:3-hydroxyisobutyrate dehydrogenase|nr:NAD(P)-dependent oxidoreductase [Gammaproteobacteria bacterium]MBT6042974.1 NAD(P)-dependent oxidoreductase [Gammaproteobacteria bacterium]
MSCKVAFIGLGVMGFPMAGHLANAGHSVTVFNRTAEKAQLWVESYQGETAATPALAATDADYIFTCVGNDDDLREVTIGADGAFEAAKAGAIFIDNTTTSAIVARELSAIAEEKGFSFLDAPVSGGQAGAENGKLTVMIGGDESAFEKAEPVIASFAASIKLLGPSGYGQLTKMVNQICIAGLVQALSEGIHFAKHAGLDVEKVIGVISKGAAQSWQMENRYQTMMNNEFDFGFAVDWMRKDLGIAMEEATKNGASLPVTKIVDGYYSELQQSGGNRWDTSSLIARLEK